MVYLTVLTILFAVLAIYAFISRQKVNTKVKEENAVLLEKNQNLSKEYNDLFDKKRCYLLEVTDLQDKYTSLVQSVGYWQNLESESRTKIEAQREEL